MDCMTGAKEKPSPRRVAVEMAERVLGLYPEKYFDFNVRDFHEKLRDEQDIKLSYIKSRYILVQHDPTLLSFRDRFSSPVAR